MDRPISSILAPHGRLRAAINVGNSVLAQRDPKSGAVSGVSVALAQALGKRLATPVDLVVFDAAGKVFDAAEKGIWDIAFLGHVPERSGALVFTEPYVYVEATALVHKEAPFKCVADLDVPGVTLIGVKGSAYDPHLARNIKQARLVLESSPAAALALFDRGGGSAVAGVRQVLEDAAKDRTHVRVLPDPFVRVEQAVALLRTSGDALPYVADFLREMRSNGFVRAQLDATGQTGAVVPS